MTNPCMTLTRGNAVSRAVRPSRRLATKALLKVAVALAVAIVLMIAETWIIEQSPRWSTACVLTPARSARNSSDDPSDAEGPFRDTAGPIAVLH